MIWDILRSGRAPRLSIMAAALIVASAAAAQTLDPAKGQRMIERSEFEELFVGKTTYFELEDGTLWGREYYSPNTQRTIFIFFATGDCYEGRWAQIEDRFCFYYRDQPSCWMTFWEDGRIIVVSRDGVRQRVRKIVDFEPLSCAPAVTS